MRKPYRIILAIAVAITTLLFWFDHEHDIPSVPYTMPTWEMVAEVLIFAPVYIVLLFGMAGGIYRKLFDDYVKPKNRTGTSEIAGS